MTKTSMMPAKLMLLLGVKKKWIAVVIGRNQNCHSSFAAKGKALLTRNVESSPFKSALESMACTVESKSGNEGSSNIVT